MSVGYSTATLKGPAGVGVARVGVAGVGVAGVAGAAGAGHHEEVELLQ